MKFNPDKPYNEMHRYCAYRTGYAQKIKAFVQTILSMGQKVKLL
ncbi:MAG: hypothetical protein C5S38_05205 [Candidatus Methanophagaceae archaeon]|jgi:hypothetical protein|nr:MAG: hypothetical protein C5S38_05205 [Methanophagales archaeon]KAF5436179.1 hypothetical protein C5S36_01035 [Methanophagales archaeon]